MANLKVVIVIRTKIDGKRGWVPATGKKSDPAGPLYLRWYAGGAARYVLAGDYYDEAEAAQFRLARKLKAQSEGFTLPEDPTDGKELRSWRTCLKSYIDHQTGKTKRNGWGYDARSTRARGKVITEFSALIGKPFIESYTALLKSRQVFQLVDFPDGRSLPGGGRVWAITEADRSSTCLLLPEDY